MANKNLGDPTKGPQATRVIKRAAAVGEPGKKKFLLNNRPVTRAKARDVLGSLFNTMDKSKHRVERKVPDTGRLKKLVAKMQGGRTSVPPGTTIDTKSRSPKGKSKPIKTKKSKK